MKFVRICVWLAAVISAGIWTVGSEAKAQTMKADVETFLSQAQQSAGRMSRTQLSLKEEAQQAFKTGEKSASYNEILQANNFQRSVKESKGKRVVIFWRVGFSLLPPGDKEIRIILTTDREDNVVDVDAKIFIHNL